MSRRTFCKAQKGQVYAIEWPEWHVECADDNCEETVFISVHGECMTAREADKRMASGEIEDGSEGWTKRSGLWYCPLHAVVFAFLLPLPLPAQAGTMLLAEFEFNQAGDVELPADYIFSIDNVPDTVSWIDTIDVFPTVQIAPAELAARFNAILTGDPNEDRRVFFYNEPFGLPGFSTRPFDHIWFPDTPGDGWRAQAFVPFVPDPGGDPERRLGVGLWGYIVTGLERTITAESQTVRLYGHIIPEPAAWLLVLCGVMIHWRKRWDFLKR